VTHHLTSPLSKTFTPAPISFAPVKARDHSERFQIEPPQLRPSGLGDKAHTEIIKAVMTETSNPPPSPSSFVASLFLTKTLVFPGA